MSILSSISSSVRPVSSHRGRPVRVTERPATPFGSGVLPVEPPSPWSLLCSPIDSRSLPDINGRGLTTEESRRITGAYNRAFAAYANDCPDARLSELEMVARKAATDELRRALRDRPVAPALAEKVEIEPAATKPSLAAPRLRVAIDPILERVNKENSLAAAGLLAARGRVMRHSFAEFDAWMEDGCPDPEPALSDDGNGFFGWEGGAA